MPPIDTLDEPTPDLPPDPSTRAAERRVLDHYVGGLEDLPRAVPMNIFLAMGRLNRAGIYPSIQFDPTDSIEKRLEDIARCLEITVEELTREVDREAIDREFREHAEGDDERDDPSDDPPETIPPPAP